MILPDLKRTTTKGKWWLGRKLTLRIHLGAFLLQWLYNLTDRQVERAIKDNAAYQLFCGRGSVDTWHSPDHTKIEVFRSRLSPETQRQMANIVAVWATELVVCHRNFDRLEPLAFTRLALTLSQTDVPHQRPRDRAA
jgi:IS5 family transposase